AHVLTSGADANNVAGRRDIETNARAHRRVANAVGVVRERTLTNGSVEAAVDVVKERINTVSCVAVAVGVANERANNHMRGRVGVAGCGARERFSTDGRVAAVSGEAEKRIVTLCRVEVGIASVRCRANRSHCRRKAKANEHEWDEKEGEPQRRAPNRICYRWNCHFELDGWIHVDLSFFFPAALILRIAGPEGAKNLAGEKSSA